MKLMIKLMLVLLMLLVVGPFFLPINNGKPLFNISDLKLPDFSNLFGSSQTSKVVIIPSDPEDKSTKDNTATDGANKNITTVHKWIDETGVVQFSDQYNPQGESEQLRINTNANIVKSTPVEKEVEAEEKQATKETAASSLPNIPLPTTVPLDEVPKLMDQTKQLKQQMEERYKQQEDLLKSFSSQKK